MQSATWTVERRLLEAQITKAAQAWHGMLTQLGAEVIGTEVWLKGDLGSLGIHGQADALLALPGNRLLIVDYKKSSASSRRPRMERGYDSQVERYRKMLQTGGLKDVEKVEMGNQLKNSDEIGVVYYNMNDTTALSDTGLAESSKLPGWEVLGADVGALVMTTCYLTIASGTINLDWRMGWDSNPRDACTPAGFQDRSLQPLGHPSAERRRVSTQAGGRNTPCVIWAWFGLGQRVPCAI